MNFDLSLLQGRIYLPWDRPLRGRGGGNRSVYIHGICIQWRRRGGPATRGANTRFDYFRVVSKPISDFCTILLSRAEQRIIPSDPPEKEGRGSKKKANFWLKEKRKKGAFILIFHPSPLHPAALRFPFHHHSTFLRGRSSWSWILFFLFFFFLFFFLLLLLSLNTSTCDEIQFYSADCVSL